MKKVDLSSIISSQSFEKKRKREIKGKKVGNLVTMK